MKKILSVVLVGLCLLIAVPANAQFGFGLKAGANFSGKVKDIDVAKAGDTGWFVGPTAKFIIPVVGLGFEANALYSNSSVTIGGEKFYKNSIEIPVYLRYELKLPAISKIIAPFIAIGPQWGYAFGKKEFGTDLRNIDNVEDAQGVYDRYFKFNDSCFSLNAGLGIVLFNHVQIHANYNIALGQTCEYIGTEKFNNVGEKIEAIKSKNNIWQISLAYIF